MSAQEIENLTRRIAEALDEPAEKPQRRIYQIVTQFGIETAKTFLEETLAIEASGGLSTYDGSRRRTPGGVFFHLAQQRAVTRAQKAIFFKWPPSDKRLFVNHLPLDVTESQLREWFEQAGEVRRVEQFVDQVTGRLKNHALITMATVEAAQEAIQRLDGAMLTDRPLVVKLSDPKPPKPPKPPGEESALQKREAPVAQKVAKPPKQPAPPQLPPFVYAERIEIFQRLLDQKGQASSVKVTLIGKPGAIEQRQNLVVTTISYKHKLPLALPKGVPQPPEAPTDYVVYIANKQWKAVGEALAANPDDVLIVEGVCSYDDDLPGMAVFAMNVTTKLLQQAKRTPKQAGTAPDEKV